MKSVLTLCAGLVLGGLVLWSIQQLGGEGEPKSVVTPTLSGEQPPDKLRLADPAPTSPESSTSSDRGLEAGLAEGPVLVVGPLFNEQEPRRIKTPSLADGGLFEPTAAGELNRDLRQIVDISALEKERELSRATFDIGEHDRGKRMLERFYDMWKDNSSFDLTPEVERLLKVENEFTRRREYAAYLNKGQDSGALFEEQLRRGVKSLAKADDGKAAAFAAWEDLTLAYELARSGRERAVVLTQLNPFLKRMVFSGRSTFLLTTYTVKAGDNLSSIASRFNTTVGSILRLGGLKSNVIQPRQRLRLLTGKVRVYIHKSDFRLWASIDDRFLLEFPVGLGSDDRTPVGHFVIRVKEKDPTWWKSGKAPIPANDPRNILGSRWLGFADTEEFSGFGIHGTTDPSSIGRASSAGCVRLLQKDIETLFDFVPYKAEVAILR